MMDLEQDAMLTAIGQMSMEEAREKWAPRWNEFVQSMSRWKSLHTLLRLVRLNAEQRRLAQYITELSLRKYMLGCLNDVRSQLIDDINGLAAEINEIGEYKDLAETASKGPYVWEDFSGEKFAADDNLGFEAPVHRGKYGRKKGYRDSVAAAIEAAALAKEYEEAGGDAKLLELNKRRDRLRRDKNESESRIKNTESELEDAKMNQLRIIDEYDITKPYAMGLLVADIFKSLAMAIEGEIY